MPTVHVNLAKIAANIAYARDFCARRGLNLLGAAKGCNAYPPIVRLFQRAGVTRLGMSRLEHVAGLAPDLAAQPVLLALPSPHLAVDVVRSFSVSLNSEPGTVKRLAQAAEAVKTDHEVMLMIEVGDLREGIMPDDVQDVAREMNQYCSPRLRITGLGTQFSCMSGLLPNHFSLEKILDAASRVEKITGHPLDTVSVGGSDFLRWLETNDMPPGIHEVRVGFSILLGRLPDTDLPHPHMHHDALSFEATVLEVKEKPSIPWGATGINAFGEKPMFVDKGIRQRAILDFGAIETDPSGLTCLLDGVSLLGFNSNYAVFDVSDADKPVRPGDHLFFRMNYKAMTLAFYSPLVNKVVDRDAVDQP